jgi:hypothetical protein
MDTFSVLIFRLESYILRLKLIYSYIFRVFLPPVPEDDEKDNGIFDNGPNNVRL